MEKDHVHGIVKQVVNITDEDWVTFRKGSSGVYRFFSRIDDIMKHRIVAEVIRRGQSPVAPCHRVRSDLPS